MTSIASSTYSNDEQPEHERVDALTFKALAKELGIAPRTKSTVKMDVILLGRMKNAQVGRAYQALKYMRATGRISGSQEMYLREQSPYAILKLCYQIRENTQYAACEKFKSVLAYLHL
jgi:hypothetical protein